MNKGDEYVMRIVGAPELEITMSSEKANDMIRQVTQLGVNMIVNREDDGQLVYALPVSQIAAIYRTTRADTVWDE